MSRIVCGVDLGGTKISTGLVTEDGKVINSIKIPTLAAEGPEAVIDRIIKSVNDVLEMSGLKLEDIAGIGIGSPGPLDAEKGVIITTPNLPGWNNLPLVEKVKEKLNTNVKLDNDANAAAYGEYIFGEGRGIKNFMYITVSTGIGGGVVLNGKLLHGANSNAAEIGHMTIDFNGPRCNCGNLGCFEAFASGTGLARFANETVNKGRESLMKELAGSNPIKAEQIFEAARKGDALALELIEKEGFYLGVGLANLMVVYNPEKIAIGGGVSKQWDMFYDNMIKTAKERVLRPNFEVCSVVPAKLGDNIGVLGAAAIALEL
jgi:glucokinase